MNWHVWATFLGYAYQAVSYGSIAGVLVVGVYTTIRDWRT